jgi:hypothetical protein
MQSDILILCYLNCITRLSFLNFTVLPIRLSMLYIFMVMRNRNSGCPCVCVCVASSSVAVCKVNSVTSTMPWRHMIEWLRSSTHSQPCSRLRWVVSFIPRVPYVSDKIPQYSSHGRLVQPQSHPGHFWEQKHLVPARNRTTVTWLCSSYLGTWTVLCWLYLSLSSCVCLVYASLAL